MPNFLSDSISLATYVVSLWISWSHFARFVTNKSTQHMEEFTQTLSRWVNIISKAPRHSPELFSHPRIEGTIHRSKRARIVALNTQHLISLFTHVPSDSPLLKETANTENENAVNHRNDNTCRVRKFASNEQRKTDDVCTLCFLAVRAQRMVSYRHMCTRTEYPLPQVADSCVERTK